MSYYPDLDDYFAPERRPSPEYQAAKAELQRKVDALRAEVDAGPKISPREALIRMRDEMEQAA